MTAVIPRFSASRGRGGFTLVETSLAMGLMVALAVALTGMLQQHVTFLSLAKTQSFLTREAPAAGDVMSRIMGKADHFFVYASREAALGGASPVLAGGGAARLFFLTATQEFVERWITAEDVSGTVALKCHITRADGTESSWTICQGLESASFSVADGILSVTVGGPHGEEITFSGGAQ